MTNESYDKVLESVNQAKIIMEGIGNRILVMEEQDREELIYRLNKVKTAAEKAIVSLERSNV